MWRQVEFSVARVRRSSLEVGLHINFGRGQLLMVKSETRCSRLIWAGHGNPVPRERHATTDVCTSRLAQEQISYDVP